MKGNTEKVEVTAEDCKELRKLYNRAVKENKTEFEWKNQLVLTSYAKYLLEYLEPKFKNQ